MLSTITVAQEQSHESDIVITEIMFNPKSTLDAIGEYFEVVNIGSHAISLKGWLIKDLGGEDLIIDEEIIIEPNHYYIFGASDVIAHNGGVVVDYVYGSKLSFDNNEDAILLINAEGELMDVVIYHVKHFFSNVDGASIYLENNLLNNTVMKHWKLSEAPIVQLGEDFGSPGKENFPTYASKILEEKK